MTTIIRQGEVRMEPIAGLPDGVDLFEVAPVKGVIIVGESEGHHHHVLDADGVTVMERKTDVPEGMRILYAIVRNPTKIHQTAGNPHGAHDVPVGIYAIRIKREFDPFAEQARRVAD